MSQALSVGVVVPVYRGRAWVADALSGVTRQTFRGMVYTVLVEDGSPPEEVVRDVAVKFGVQYVAFPENRGVFAARVAGFHSLPPVDYVAFLDQDDWWEPDFLQRLVQVLVEHPAAPFAASNVMLSGTPGAPALYTERKPRLRLADFKVANQLATPSQVVARYTAVRQANLDPQLSRPGSDDWLLWLALLREGDGIYVDEPLAHWRQHADAFHRRRLALRSSEDAVVQEWFLRLGFSHQDIRRYWGRIALDAIVQRNSWDEWWSGWGILMRDPIAVLAAIRFRYDHRRNGVV
jgi:glycosyltransferase involved in cell wall biosynthesis